MDLTIPNQDKIGSAPGTKISGEQELSIKIRKNPIDNHSEQMKWVIPSDLKYAVYLHKVLEIEINRQVMMSISPLTRQKGLSKEMDIIKKLKNER